MTGIVVSASDCIRGWEKFRLAERRGGKFDESQLAP